MNDKIYAVESISIFKHIYYIKAKNESDALDEFVYRINDDSFIEGSQKFIDNVHTSARELTEEEFIKDFDKNNEYAQDWSVEQKLKLVNQIDYK